MKKLSFHYNMSLEFSQPITNHHFKLKCLPQTSSRQIISDLSFELTPSTAVSGSTDGFGNLTRYGSIYDTHTLFSVTVTGVCELNGGFFDTAVKKSTLGLFRVQTLLTEPGKTLRNFLNNLNLPYTSNLDKARRIMSAVYNHFEYTPRATGVATIAEESFKLQKGVCQDYAQVMLSICRAVGIPCRYVTGLLMGEGETHAWVEVESGGKWYGLDPTNNVEVGENHIVISTGRDSTDCSINRGTFCGNGTQLQKIYVKVEELNDTNNSAGGTPLR